MKRGVASIGHINSSSQIGSKRTYLVDTYLASRTAAWGGHVICSWLLPTFLSLLHLLLLARAHLLQGLKIPSDCISLPAQVHV
jgi:hypothetical protein